MQSKLCIIQTLIKTEIWPTCYRISFKLTDYVSLFYSDSFGSIIALIFDNHSSMSYSHSVLLLRFHFYLFLLLYHISRPSPAACRGSQWPPAAAATAVFHPPIATAKARWLLGCRSQRRWTSVQRVSAISVKSDFKNKRLNQTSGLTVS